MLRQPLSLLFPDLLSTMTIFLVLFSGRYSLSPFPSAVLPANPHSLLSLIPICLRPTAKTSLLCCPSVPRRLSFLPFQRSLRFVHDNCLKSGFTPTYPLRNHLSIRSQPYHSLSTKSNSHIILIFIIHEGLCSF